MMKILTKNYVHSWFCPICILLIFGSIYLGVCPPGCLSTWNLSTRQSGYMTFSSRRIVFTYGSVNTGLSLGVVLFTWDYVHLGLCLLGSCPLGSLAKLHSAHVRLCSLLFLSTLDSANFGSLYLGVCPPGFLFTWNLATWESGHMTFFPNRIVSRIGSVNS